MVRSVLWYRVFTVRVDVLCCEDMTRQNTACSFSTKHNLRNSQVCSTYVPSWYELRELDTFYADVVKRLPQPDKEYIEVRRHAGEFRIISIYKLVYFYLEDRRTAKAPSRFPSRSMQ